MSTNPFGKKGWTPERLGNLKGKTYLITGANTGAGFEGTRILLEHKAKVVMLNRNPKKSEQAIKDLQSLLGSQAEVSFIKMDLNSLHSVAEAAQEVRDTVPRVEALICNAAIAQVPNPEFTSDGFESQLGVNHYGHFLLCGLLFDYLEAASARIVVVGSEGYKMGLKTMQFEDMNWNKNYHPMKTYCHSKLAQMLFAYELQDRIKAAGKKVKVLVCHPGASATSLVKNSGGLRDRIIFGIMSKTPLVQSAAKGSYPEVMCATESLNHLPEKNYYGPTGMMNWKGPVGACDLEPHAQDKALATKLWDFSEQATGYHWNL